MGDSTKYKVAVNCCTYNQSQYITDALNGFVMQGTDFPFVCCIVDDASTDGEQEVIRRYVSENFDLEEADVAYEKETDDAYITYARHKSNRNCFFAVVYLKRNLYHESEKRDSIVSEWMDDAEYIALCEGDDYWIDAKKLQKQVDYLETHPDYMLVHSDFTVVNANGKIIKRNGSSKYIISEGNVFEDLFMGCWVRTLTVLYRNDAGVEFPDLPSGCFRGDAFTFYVLARYGKFHFMQEETGAYRTLRNSASHYTDEARRFAFAQSIKKLDYYMAEFYGASPEVIRSLNERWAINEFKHSLYARDYECYARANLSSVKQSRGCLAVCCRLCGCKPVFYLISAAVRFRIVCMRLLRQA